MTPAAWHPSPNFGERRGGAAPSLIVLHYTALPSAAEALERLSAPEHEVSAHYLIGRDGQLWQMVAEDHRAWHAGAGSWGGAGDVNSRSIGIELDCDGRAPFAAPLMDRLEALLAEVMERHGIGAQGVIGHSDMAPDRKVDPGPRFDWRRLALAGLAVWPEAGSPGDLWQSLAAFGYPVGDRAATLAAFRARFRPGVEGPEDDTDARLAADLARRFPVDREPGAA